jgi:hypothetical protein
MLTVLGSPAEFERELIRTLTGEGREQAKARGVILGRKPKLTNGERQSLVERRERSLRKLFADKSPWLLLPLVLAYAVTVPADSGALTSGMTMSANPHHRGATMATHSTVGFGLSALGAWGVGMALDLAGGPLSATAWMAAFSVLALGILFGPVALYWSRHVALQQ